MTTALSAIARRVNTWFKAYRHAKPKEIASSLLILPVEVLTEILKLLAWRDVLYVRGVCRYLAEATKTREIWSHLIYEHVLANTSPPILERPIEMHSAKELERLLLHWKSAELGWRADALHSSWERTFVGVQAKFVHLLKGGRWLLVTENTGAVTYYDLDVNIILGAPLIPDQMQRWTNSRVLVSIDLDTKSHFLEFTIAFSLQDASPSKKKADPTRNRRTIQIWRVTVVLDDTQHAVGLTATRIASFIHRHDIIMVKSISLLGPNIAFTSITDPFVYAIVVDWTKANGNSVRYPWRVVQRTTANAFIYLLPGWKLLVASDEDYSLFDYSLVPETTQLPEASEYSCPFVWQVEGPRCTKLSSCFFTEKRASIVVGSIASLFTISFDYTSVSNESPAVLQLTDLPSLHFCARASLGCQRTIVIDYDGQMTMINYEPSINTRQEPTAVFRKCLLSNTPGPPEPMVDEESGRVVYSISPGEPEEPLQTEFAVADFAVIYKP